MKLIRVSRECCDKCLSTCLQFRLKIEGCAIRGYDIDFNITQVCTEYHKNQTKIIPPVPRKAVITKMPAIPEVEEQITPVVTKIGPNAIKKRGVQKLIVNPKWSLKRVEMGVQVNASHVRPECAPFLRNSFMDWTTWLQKSMPPNFRNKRDLTGLLGTGLGVLNTIDSEVLLNKLTTIGSDLVKLQQPLQSSLLALGNNHWKLTKILPEWEDTEERDHEVIINALGTASENISLALGCTQAQLWMQSVAAAVIRESGEGIFPAEIHKIVWDNASDMERELQSWLQLTEGLHLKDDNWNFVSVDNSEQGTWPRVKGKLIVVGDCKHTPKEIEILPGTLDNNPGKFVHWLRCTHPPTFLPKGQTVAQIIPTWERLEEDNIPTACPVHNITEVKPQVGCELQVGDEAINITGLLDTGADVTVIPAKHWPSRWALENVAGHVQGIGGMQLAKQSKSVVQIKGPKGQLASLRPFVLDYREPLLGRDLMAQWGVTIDIPDPPQDFWAAVAEERPTHKLNWKTDAPVWVEQWPLSKQKLKALEELVEEQLAKGHIVETTSPWNLPVFCYPEAGEGQVETPPRSQTN
ncbi:hypothetical protein DUI87_02777 [Hirundo rustica rustica]|uniref:Peptidase A2 domain-containing protein n=1 Tax=Hirundo rustica rustica TaxID=333673 RepID=A0A3M0LA71_HIRRU|nr:hypothetical protein DUI87_02777 [Hirundo rustica rustica]